MTTAQLIMIADADPFVREMVGRFVEDGGYAVCFAVDGYDALDKARKVPPAAIIADLMLPRLDGLALCRILKSDPAVNEIVSVIISSVLSVEERAKTAGASAFLQKPLEKSRLLNVLKTAIFTGGAT